MSSKEHVHTLMTEIGPLLDLMAVTEYDSENAWTILVDEDTFLFADFDEPQKRLVLSAEAGRPQAGNRKFIYEILLQYNNQWHETGGVRMALDGPEGSVVQIFDLSVVDLDIGQLQTTVANFVDTLKAWREILAKEKTDEESPPPESGPAVDPGITGGAIRA
jgi:hypothetical protein